MPIMAVTATNIQSWIWKMLKASSKNCAVAMLKYPLISFSSLCLILLYMFLPLVFWIFICSAPILFLIPILRKSRRKPHIVQKVEDKTSGKEKKDENVVVGEDGKPFRRVHSVRRRKAKEIKVDEAEKIEVPSISFNVDPVIDKSTLIEESTNEIRDVEVDSSACAKDYSSIDFQNPKPDFCIKSLNFSDDDDDGEKDDQDNVMEVGISEEENKRLESLIARRRARKWLSLHVRKTLANIDKNIDKPDLPAPVAFPSLVIPKHNNGSFLPNSSSTSHMSTSPGSAPSILMPMRNPFDLPYDPQEEKPDLTGDSFQQEFTSPPTKDVMFCRHESFSLGPSSPEVFNHGKEKTSFQHEFGSWQRAPPKRYEFHTPAPRFFTDSESARLLEPEPTQAPETNSISETEDDQIKEVIQVCEKGTDKNENIDSSEVDMKPVPLESSSTTSGSSSSSEEDTPFFKIDKEAVLKNLFSPRTPAARANEISRIGDNSNYFASPLKRNSLEEHMYQANRTMRHHAPSYSLASDMQVEFSEISSPRTVDDSEEASDMEQKLDIASGNLASDLFKRDRGEYRLRELDEISEGDLLEVGYSRINSSENLSSMDENPLTEEHKIYSCFSSDSLQEEITDVFRVNGNEYSSREIDEISEDVGYSRANSSTDLPKIVEDSAAEEKDNQSCSTLPSVQELADSSQGPERNQATNRSDSLQEKLHESSRYTAQENGQQSTEHIPSHENDSRKHLDVTTIKTEHLEKSPPVTIEHVEGRSSNPAEISCHHTEHSLEGNIISSEDSGEIEEKVVTPVVFEIQDNFEHYEGESSSATRITMDSDDAQEVSPTQNEAVQRIPFVQSPTISPKSVLQPSFSVDLGSTASFDQLVDQEQLVRNNVQILSPAGNENSPPIIEHPVALPSGDGNARDVEISQLVDQEQLVRNNVQILSPAGNENSPPIIEHPVALPSGDGNVRDVEISQLVDQEQLVRNNVQILSPAGNENSPPIIEHPVALPSSDGNVRDVEISQESAESSTPHVETGNSDSINELKSHENGVKPEVASDSTHILSMHEALPDQFKPVEESGSRCFNTHNEIPSKSFEAGNPSAYSGEMGHANNSDSLLSVDEELYKHQEVTGDAVKHDDDYKSRICLDKNENSTSAEDAELEHNLDNHYDHKETTNSIGSKESQEESLDSESVPVEENVNSEYHQETKILKTNTDSHE